MKMIMEVSTTNRFLFFFSSKSFPIVLQILVVVLTCWKSNDYVIPENVL